MGTINLVRLTFGREGDMKMKAYIRASCLLPLLLFQVLRCYSLFYFSSFCSLINNFVFFLPCIFFPSFLKYLSTICTLNTARLYKNGFGEGIVICVLFISLSFGATFVFYPTFTVV